MVLGGVRRLIPWGEMSQAKGKREGGYLVSVTNRPRFGRYSQLPSEAYWGLLGLTGAYWGLLRPTVISVSTWLPVSSVLSASYCLDRHCVPKSLVTPECDRTISNASTAKIYAYLRNEQILIDIGKYDRQIVLPNLFIRLILGQVMGSLCTALKTEESLTGRSW
jgi:hypothetical protein